MFRFRGVVSTGLNKSASARSWQLWLVVWLPIHILAVWRLLYESSPKAHPTPHPQLHLVWMDFVLQNRSRIDLTSDPNEFKLYKGLFRLVLTGSFWWCRSTPKNKTKVPAVCVVGELFSAWSLSSSCWKASQWPPAYSRSVCQFEVDCFGWLRMETFCVFLSFLFINFLGFGKEVPRSCLQDGCTTVLVSSRGNVL